MNDSQTTVDSTGSQYGQTQNPQTPGGQSLATEAAGNLQTVSTPNLFSGQNSVSITRVGDGTFTSYTPENTTKASVGDAPKVAAQRPYPVIIGSGVLIALVLVVSWLIIRRQSSY
jgi:hypothetical protein